MKNKRIVYVSDVKEMNQRIKFCIENRFYAPTEDYARDKVNRQYYYTLDIKYTKLILRYKPKGETYGEYVFALDGSEKAQQINGALAFNLLQRMSNSGVVDLTGNWNYYDSNNDQWLVGHIAGLLWFNPKYEGGRYPNCIEYDTNNSYSYAMLGDIPETKSKPRLNDYVKEGEIGFRLTQRGISEENYLYAIFEPGRYADYIYKAIPSPFENFVKYYYNKRKKAKDSKEREKIKQILNYAVGYIARKNPFIHSCILSRARYRIEQFIDVNTTLYSNTDSIVSMCPRPDIEELLGDEVGQFHINHKGDFAYNGSGYQWNHDSPSIRGRSKNWFDKKFDILTDKIPFVEANKYYFDREENKIKLCPRRKNTQK